MSDSIGVLSGGSMSEGAMNSMGANPNQPAGSYTREGNVYVRSDNYGDKFYYPVKWADQGTWIQFDSKKAASQAHDMPDSKLQSFMKANGGQLMAGSLPGSQQGTGQQKQASGNSLLGDAQSASPVNEQLSLMSQQPEQYKFTNPKRKKKQNTSLLS